MKTFNLTRSALLSAALFALASIAAFAQNGPVVRMTHAEASAAIKEGSLPADANIHYTDQRTPSKVIKPVIKDVEGKPKGGGAMLCNCWVEPNGDYTLINNGTEWFDDGFPSSDDGSHGPIQLPFTFNLYGDQYNQVYVNINGNLSFGTENGVYSSTGFPTNSAAMVAPFWADVDLGNANTAINKVQYKVTPTAMYVNWSDVGYFNEQTNKLNSFQLIITDGNDPVIGLGNNVSFCYRDMQWTTGGASQGVNGLGGVPATVGANRGNNVNFIQFGRFDQAGVIYDGPFGANDGVDWLDGQDFRFTTAVATTNIPPIVSSTFLCDTVRVCTGELVDYDLTFLTPESDQIITGATSSAPTLPSYQDTHADNGTQYTITSQFIPGIADVGFHTITYTASDNGEPALTSTVTIVIEVSFTPAIPPTITGDTITCADQGVVLTASAGYDEYLWNNGYFGNTVLVGPGTYIVEATSGPCRLASNTIVVHEAPAVGVPVIDGVLFNCGGQPALLSTTQPYAHYQWSNGSTDPSISVGSGTYSVTVENASGCQGTSLPVTVNSAPNPDAHFTADGPNPTSMGDTITYTYTNSPIVPVSYAWSVDTSGVIGTGTTFTHYFPLPGFHEVTLVVTSSDGCTDTFVYTQTVMPDTIIIPNVFTPNGDGKNDRLSFEGAQYFPDTELKVFNRFGKVLYESRDYKNTWVAHDVPDGTYYYLLRLYNGKEYSGHVTLLR